MADLSHFWGNDLSVSPTGDIALVQPLNTQDATTYNGNDEGTQRIYRRLMTAVAMATELSGEDIFAPNYGGGIPQKIGDTIDANAIKGLCRRQLALEAVVAKSPQPVITVTVVLPSTVYVNIQYTNAQTGEPISLAFDSTQLRNA